MSEADMIIELLKKDKEIERLYIEIRKLEQLNMIQRYRIEVIDKRELISKDTIRDFIKENLPDDEIMQSCEVYDVNGVELRKELEKLLKIGEKDEKDKGEEK